MIIDFILILGQEIIGGVCLRRGTLSWFCIIKQTVSREIELRLSVNENFDLLCILCGSGVLFYRLIACVLVVVA